MGVRGKILHARAELQDDVALLTDGGGERGLQIAAMDHPIGCAVTLRRRAKLHANDLAAAGAVVDTQRSGRNDVAP